MHGLVETYRLLNSELTVASKVAEQWASAFRGEVQPKSTRLMVPLKDLVGRFIELEPAILVLPEKLQTIPDQKLSESLKTRYRRVAVRTGCTPPALTRRLSELAFEVASFRVLIDPKDAFDVTSFGTLTTVALINGLHLLGHWKRYAKLTGDDLRQVTRKVWWPLHLADTFASERRPGDIWIADLAARTFRAAVRAVSQDFQHKPTVKVLGGLVLEFVTRSLLNKVMEAESLGKMFLPHAKYELWPGLETIVSADDALSLRNVLATELVQQVVAHPVGYSAVAFLRLLGRLPQLPDEHVWGTRLLFAQILWELLECDPNLLKKLLAQGPVATTLLECLRFLRNWKGHEPEARHEPLRNRLRDVMACLESYDQFSKLMRLVDVGLNLPTAKKSAPVSVSQ